MKLPNPKDYDFLWLAHGQTYLFLSIFLTEVYTSRDFLATVKNKKHRFYIGKQQRKQLQNLGLNFLQKKLPQYKRIVDNKIIAFKKLFKKVKESNLSKLTNKELADSFLKTVKLIRPIIREYFYTEYFLHDKAQKRIKENPDKNQELLKKVQEMQKIKIHLRDFALNKTIFKGNIFEPYIKEIKKRLPDRNLASLSYPEIGKILKGKKIDITNRGTYVLGKFNNWKVIAGKQADEIIDLFEKDIHKKESTELRGQIANQGYYKGLVKIIPFDIENDITPEINKMRKGDVLVTGSTGPEMILACKKAGAMVTEEGGDMFSRSHSVKRTKNSLYHWHQNRHPSI